MDLNQLVVSGKVMQLTKTGNSNGTKMALGTVGLYRGKSKDNGKPEFDNVPFVAYGAVSEYIKQDLKMVLSGKINTYQKNTGGQYKTTVVQMQVLQAYPIATSDKPAIKEHKSEDQIDITDNDLPF